MKITIAAALGGLAALALAGLPSFAASIAPLAGADRQITPPGSTFATPIAVQVLDDAGQPARGVRVRFTSTGPTLAVPPEVGAQGFTPLTDAQGIATLVNVFTATNTTGTVNLQAAVESMGISVQMTLYIAGFGSNFTDTISAAQQTTPVSTAFPLAPVARAYDAAGGNSVPRARCGISKSPVGASGTFATAPAVNGITVFADANGFVNSPALIANATPGTWELTVSCGFSTSGTRFTLINTALGAVRITPGGPYAAAPNSRQTVEVTVRGEAGNPLAGRTVEFHPSYIAQASVGISPRSVVTNAQGVARTDLIFSSEPGWVGVEASTGGEVAILHASVGAPSFPTVQSMWWGGSAENGWGMSLIQHGEKLFAVIYAYDAAGSPTWWVLPNGTWNATRNSYSGAVYSPRGSPYFAYDATRFAPGAAVGNVTIAFANDRNATLSYTINGITGTRSITQQQFGADSNNGYSAGLGEMWWGGVSQNGWGISMVQQQATVFPAWFTYDAAGLPVWYVMPGGTWTTPTTYEGRMYRTTSSPWLGATYNAAALQIIDVGSFRLTFTFPNAMFEYTADGKSGTIPLTRNGF